MNKLIDYCEKISKDKELLKKYISTSDRDDKFIGKFYAFVNTNFRTINSYSNAFIEFEKVENLRRIDWPKKNKSNQEIHKQYKNPMVQTKLFRLNTDFFQKTEKGQIFKNIKDSKVSNDLEWFLIFIFLLDSNLLLIQNYFLYQYEKIIALFNKLKIDDEKLFMRIERLIKIDDSKTFKLNLIKDEIFILHTFFKDLEFLELYFSSNDQEKKDFMFYIEKAFEDNDNYNFIFRKYNSTNYSFPSVKDELKLLYFSNEIFKDLSYGGLINTYSIYSNFYNVDNNFANDFFLKNRTFLEEILLSQKNDRFLLENDWEIIDENDKNHFKEFFDDKPVLNSEETEYNFFKKSNRRFSKFKQYSKEVYQYKCFFENENNCNYFPTKKDGNNYIEIHHLIPRAFKDQFGYSIEVGANYVSLCAVCHRMIHLGDDKFRIIKLKQIFVERKNKLDKCNLQIDFDELKNIYGINCN